MASIQLRLKQTGAGEGDVHMGGFVVEINKDDLKRVIRSLGGIESKTPGKIKNSINRSATKTMKKIREGRKSYVIKAGTFNEAVKVYRAGQSHLDAVIKSSDKPHPLHKGSVMEGYYKTSGGRQGIKAAVTKNGMKMLETGAGKAFYATMPKTGHAGIFQREGKERLHIRELFGPGASKMVKSIFKGKRGDGNLEPYIQKALHDEIAKEINKLIGWGS